MSRPVKVVCCLCKGDRFLDMGTIKEIAARRGVKEPSIRWLTTPSYRRSIQGREDSCLIALRAE